jgi:hypothetical protein
MLVWGWPCATPSRLWQITLNGTKQKHETKPHVEVNLDSIVDFDFCDVDLDI